eukprot:1701252-Rhodomonas_salina.1
MEQWNKAQHMFCDYTTTDSSFLAGWTSGLGRDQQETILNAKCGLCHDILEEFHQGDHPMSNPPTLFNRGNTEQLAAAAVAEGVAEETTAEKEEQEEEKEEEKEKEKEKEKEEEKEQDAGQSKPVFMTPVPCMQPSQQRQAGRSSSLRQMLMRWGLTTAIAGPASEACQRPSRAHRASRAQVQSQALLLVS